MADKVYLEAGKAYYIKTKTGELEVFVSPESENYPGVDIEFIPNKAEDAVTYPRVVFEEAVQSDEGTRVGCELRALIWNDPQQEDYTDKIVFRQSK